MIKDILVNLSVDGSRDVVTSFAVSVAAKFGAHLIVIASGEPRKSDELPGADIAHHLARHGVKVEVDRIASTEADIASTILSHAAGLPRISSSWAGTVIRGCVNSYWGV